jgi:hypothetical protein
VTAAKKKVVVIYSVDLREKMREMLEKLDDHKSVLRVKRRGKDDAAVILWEDLLELMGERLKR